MEDQRTRFAFRAPNMGNAASPSHSNMGTRSQWHGMDLHTTTPSSHRRAMLISPMPQQTHVAPNMANMANANSTSTNHPNADNTRRAAEVAALSARNQMLHRLLSERKRFDSADYAMKMMRNAMQSGTPDEDSSPPAPTTTTAAVPAPTQGRLVFADALRTDHTDADGDYDMLDANAPNTPNISNNQLGSPSPTTTVQRTSAWSQHSAKSASAAMSARNLLIQKKLQEKRHFDSADYQLARLGVANDVRMEDVGKPALDRSALPFAQPTSDSDDASSPVQSPSATRAAIARSNQMSPSVRASNAATAFGNPNSKYGNLGGRANPTAGKSPNDLRRNTLLRQQENFIAAQNPRPTASSPTVAEAPTPTPTPAPDNQKYGKLIAANILFRKNLKDRKHFDSADYQMEAAAKQAQRSGEPADDNNNNSMGAVTPPASNQEDEPSSPVMKPQAKLLKLSDDTSVGGRVQPQPQPQPQSAPAARGGGGGWAKHPTVAAARESLSQGRQDGPRLAARSVMLNRKLSEGKKLFDSGDYFAAKAREARAASSRGQV